MRNKLNEELAQKAIELVSNGATNADAIAYIGVAESTFYAWIKEPKTRAQRKLSEGLKKAETERKLWHLERINSAAELGDWKASAWYLERRYPNEYARTQRISGTVETIQKPDALTEAIMETARKMEGKRDG